MKAISDFLIWAFITFTAPEKQICHGRFLGGLPYELPMNISITLKHFWKKNIGTFLDGGFFNFVSIYVSRLSRESAPILSRDECYRDTKKGNEFVGNGC